MTLAGQAVMINWCDVTAVNRPGFYAWHTHHMMDRVGIAGFRRSRRFVAVRANSDYFFIYEVDSIAVLTSQDYITRLNISAAGALGKHDLLSNSVRMLATVRLSVGIGQGGAMLTARLNAKESGAEKLKRYLTVEAIPTIADTPGILSVHLFERDSAASAVTRPGVNPPARLPRWVVAVEAVSEDAFDPVCNTHFSEEALHSHGGDRSSEQGIYRHEVTISKTL